MIELCDLERAIYVEQRAEARLEWMVELREGKRAVAGGEGRFLFFVCLFVCF